jgi:hypothetical protein
MGLGIRDPEKIYSGHRGQNGTRSLTVNLGLVTIKYKNTSWINITVPQKYVFDFKE